MAHQVFLALLRFDEWIGMPGRIANHQSLVKHLAFLKHLDWDTTTGIVLLPIPIELLAVTEYGLKTATSSDSHAG